ncbi:MAG: transporter substrate-binding protein [Gemmataceae bacterium]
MKPTPTEMRCPPLNELRRLLQPGLPEAEAARLRDHLNTCLSCRKKWENLRTETVVAPTPPLLHPGGDTNHGQPAQPSSAAANNWSSGDTLEGPGGKRPPARPLPPPDAPRLFPFLSPPREEGELGWLGDYRLARVLGEGGMGYVFDAFDTHLHRRVALKVLKPDLAANLSFRERFVLEARAAAALPDDYIITIYQVGVENNVPFLAMKFLHGESLEHRLQHEGRLSCHEILCIGREIALGLSAAHERGLIHRDIKPANIWLETPEPDREGTSSPRLSCEYLYRVKILDFGLARPIHDTRHLTATGLIVGTPQYLAPEQARGQALDHRCDLFSLGIVLYRLATGVLPFDGSDTLAQLTALAVADPQPIEELAPDLPAGLRQLIHQLLARDPANRPPTARAVAESLRALEKDETLPLSPGRPFRPGPRTRRTGKPGRWKTSQRRWWVGTGTVALLVLGMLLLWLRPRPEEAENVAAGPSGDPSAAVGPTGEPIKVGVLFSLRGSMRNGGSAAHDAVQLAVDELNEQGGLLGRRILAIHEDGESDYRKFAEAAEKLITKDAVCAIFGTRTSSNRKAVLKVVEKHDKLLFYPMQFEGMEESPNVIYLGTSPNQQMIPAVDYMVGKLGKRRLFLVGSDYVFPHSANAILRDFVEKKYPDAHILDEKYIPLGSVEVNATIQAIREKKPDLILNTINGDTNSAFFRALPRAGVRADATPVMSFSMGENDLLSIGEAGVGQYAAWSYFQSVDRPENRAFVRKFQARFTARRVISDPMETAYFSVHLWAQAVQAAGSLETRAVRASLKGRLMEAPEGTVRIDRDTLYTWRVMRIGRVNSDGQFEIIKDTEWAIQPEPFPFTRPRGEWKKFLNDLYIGWDKRWQAPDSNQ